MNTRWQNRSQGYGSGALGDNREGIEQLQLGVTDFWVISTGLLAPFTNAVALYDLLIF